MSLTRENSPSPPSSGTHRFLRKLSYFLAAGFLLYVAVGFFLVPPIVRAVASGQVEANLHAELQIESVSFNPFTLRLRLEELSLRDLKGDEVLRLGDGQFALSLSSLVHFAPVLKEILLDEPVLFVTRHADGSLNVEHLLMEVEDEAPESEGLPRLAVHRLSISQGEIQFRDLALEDSFRYAFSPISFDLEDFSTFREEGNELRFAAMALYGGSVNGKGSFTLEPMAATAELQIEGMDMSAFALYIREFVDVDLGKGSLDLQLVVNFQGDSREEMVEGNLQSLTISDLGLFPAGGQSPFFTLGTIEILNAQFGIWDPRIDVESVTVSDGWANVRRLEDGTIDLLEMLLPGGAPEPGIAEESSDPPFPLAFSVGRIGIDDFQFEVEDLSVGSDARLTGALNQGEFLSITGDLSQSIPFHLEGDFFGGGRFRTAGNLAPDPLIGEFEFAFEDILLTLFDPWVGMFADLSIGSGKAGLNGKVELREGSDTLPIILFDGTAGVGDFKAREGENSVLSFEQLDLNELFLQSEPMIVRTGLIRLQRPDATVVLEEDGNLNLLRLLRMATPEEPDAEVPESVESTPEGLLLSFFVAAIEVEEGSVSLSDRTVSPSYSTQLDGISVQIFELGSEPESRATVNISGQFPDASRIELTGRTNANANAEKLFADVNLRLTGFGLSPVSPYSGQFVGRAVDRGSLDVEVIAMVEDEKLTVRNAILLKDFRLGERVESPNALNLPLDLALALLRNRNGDISLEIPLSGQLDDPQFSIAAVSTQAFATVIRNLASSPFAALGNLVGSRSEELSQVNFLPGQAGLSEEVKGVLQELAEALYQRPGLKIEAKGTADPAVDRPALIELRLIKELEDHRKHVFESSESSDTIRKDVLNDPLLVRSYYEHRFGPLEPEDEVVELAEIPEETPPEIIEVKIEEPALQPELEPEPGFVVRFFRWIIRPTPVAIEEPKMEVVDSESLPATPEESEAPEESEEPVQVVAAVEIPSLEEMKERLLESVTISEQDLLRLGRSRSETVRDALLDSGRVESERISIGSAVLGTGPKVQFELRN